MRWARTIADPTPFLDGKINETPRFADSRSAFVRSLLSQRAASMGMSALPSSAVELEAHQIEVVRRIFRTRYSATCLPTKLASAKRSKLASSFAKLSSMQPKTRWCSSSSPARSFRNGGRNSRRSSS